MSGRRILAAAALAGVAAVLGACAYGAGGRTYQGGVILEAPRPGAEVYLIGAYEYDQAMEAQKDQPAAQREAARRIGKRVPAQGEVFKSAAGSYRAVYFCGSAMTSMPVQLLRLGGATPPNRYRLRCPA